MNEIKIETKYTVEDYVRTETFLKNLQINSSRIIKFGSRFLFVFALINLVFACIVMTEGKFGIAFFAVLSTITCFFLIYRVIPVYSVSAEMNLLKTRLKSIEPDSILYSERQITFGEEGVNETHKFGNYLTNWEAISKVIESDEDFFFYLHNSIRFQPKRDISEEQIDLLRIIIKANLREQAAFEFLTTN
jgi:YcxB-like protein